MADKYAAKRASLKAAAKDKSLSPEDRFAANIKLSQLPRNSAVVRQDVDEAEQAIEYLEEQIAATSVADLQNVFFKLIEEQIKVVMLAKVSPEYMFRTLDPAVAPELKAKPKRKLIVILGLLLGGSIGLVVVLLRGRASPQRM